MRLAFIGLGEAASAFVTGWGDGMAGNIRAYDIKSSDQATDGEIAERGALLGIEVCTSPEAALADAELVFSTVTADQAMVATQDYARFLGTDAVWCDLNSCAPASKQFSEGVIKKVGARYLDVAVMEPVLPKLNNVSCLVSGPDAAALTPVLQGLPMNVRVVGDQVGRASSIKMVRSILVKGLEALTAECTLAAAAADVEDEVFPSLKSGHPKIDLPARATYNFERTLVHGQRRAAEMDEVAKMLSDLGLPNGMAAATADWQRTLSSTDLALPEGEVPDHAWFAAEYLKRFCT